MFLTQSSRDLCWVGKVDFMKYAYVNIHISLFKYKITDPLNSPVVEFNFFFEA